MLIFSALFGVSSNPANVHIANVFEGLVVYSGLNVRLHSPLSSTSI